jgi:Family of unknown function (DUF6516)
LVIGERAKNRVDFLAWGRRFGGKMGILRSSVKSGGLFYFFTSISLYGIRCHMAARLLYEERYIYSDGAIREMVLWQLPRKSTDRPHGLKYRLYYGLGDGTCLVRFDNESGKGDHKHAGGQEESYLLIDVETLVADFLAEIEKARREEI